MTGYSTADTYRSLVDEVITSLQGYGVHHDTMGTLAVDIDAEALSFPVTGPEVGRGVLEIDQELMWVESVEGNIVRIPPWGRGHKGTRKTLHNAGAMVSVAPVYPRSIVAREVVNAIRAVYPALFAVRTAEVTGGMAHWQMELPDDCDRVLSVEWTTLPGYPAEIVSQWELNHSADTVLFPSGKLLLLGRPVIGTLRVTYAARPSLLLYEDDPFTVTGLPESSRDVVVLGAASRLLPWLDTGRVPSQTVSADLLDAKNGIGTAVSVGRELRNNYKLRLAEEQAALQAKYPTKAHKTR